MAKEQPWKTSKNALANVCRGGATAVVALALPHFLTRTLGSERFSAWSLMLQMSALAAYFDFGLQTLLGRYVAHAVERGEDETLSNLASTSMILLVVASLFPLAACILFLPLLPLLFQPSSIVILHEIQKGAAGWDLIMFHHALEHMQNHVDVLRCARGKLNVGGTCLVRIPVVSWAWEQYGRNWAQLDPPRHLVMHTRRSFEVTAAAAGFQMKQIIFDSDEFQFSASECYRRDIPYHDKRASKQFLKTR